MLRANERRIARLTAPATAARLALVLFAICVALGGCQTLEAERVIGEASARDAVQRQLAVPLAELPSVDSVPTLTDVAAIYAGRTANERLLVVVFTSREATRQFTGSTRPTGELVIVCNVVAVYGHDRGTISRLGRLRTALRNLDGATA